MFFKVLNKPVEAAPEGGIMTSLKAFLEITLFDCNS